MRPDCFAHLSDGTLLRDYAALRARRCRDAATELVYLAEIEARGLYRLAAYPDMNAYCIGELHFSEGSTYKRLRAARYARRYPALLEAIAEGRLHLTAVVLLTAHVTTSNVHELIELATHRSKRELEVLLAARFPQRDLPERIEAVSSWPVAREEVHESLSPGTNSGIQTCPASSDAPASTPPLAMSLPDSFAIPAAAQPAELPRGREMPRSADRWAYQFTGDRDFHEALAAYRALLGPKAHGWGLLELLRDAVERAKRGLEQRKCGATDHPRASRRPTNTDSRHIPASVRRAVWKRDGGRCTFVSDSGRRCEARDHLEYDHETPFSRGGTSTIGNLRLRCRTHNQLEAERTYGKEFMRQKLESRTAAGVGGGPASRASAGGGGGIRTAGGPPPAGPVHPSRGTPSPYSSDPRSTRLATEK